MQGIYLIAAHPAWRESRVNSRLLEVAQALAGALPLDIQDLYGSYPDYHIDVAAEQARVDRARLLVLLHPIQWYSVPALQKLWFDEVLTYGWAFGPATSEAGSHEQAPAGTPGTALRGKDCWLVTTTGGPAESYSAESYNGQPFEAYLSPYRQTAAVCGMRFLPPLVLHGAHGASRQDIDAHAEAFAERLRSYPHWARG
ncbi:MAG: NAD(P)H dehydrogenase [Variovorax paradoxus]|nr:MAG: NAD(P)H dehydrogenase [Variovorax paradoxus]PZQ02253.1 MAG: NAD(P)H dehydrogenase [Variovorax paradoxus]